MGQSLNLQVLDFKGDFKTFNSGTVKHGHYQSGYSREWLAMLLPLLSGRQGAKWIVAKR